MTKSVCGICIHLLYLPTLLKISAGEYFSSIKSFGLIFRSDLHLGQDSIEGMRGFRLIMTKIKISNP
jgi:hypothetical protein